MRNHPARGAHGRPVGLQRLGAKACAGPLEPPATSSRTLDRHGKATRMLSGTGSVHTRVAPAAAFAYLADPSHASEWFANVAAQELEPGPLRAGLSGQPHEHRLGARGCPRARGWDHPASDDALAARSAGMAPCARGHHAHARRAAPAGAAHRRARPRCRRGRLSRAYAARSRWQAPQAPVSPTLLSSGL